VTRAEFDAWITEHYGELFAVARRRTNNDADAADAVQNAVLRTLANGKLAGVRRPWTWMVNALRSTTEHLRRGGDRTDAALRGLKAEARTHAGVYQGRRRPAPRAE
jgi:DNA-directed RNA polymerase specialized sigma24 family protein